MKKVFIDPKTNRTRVQTINTDPETKAQQHFKDTVDINSIMKKYRHIDYVPNFQSTGVYADVSNFKDYQTSLQIVLDAQMAFGTLPSDLRLRFNNDPEQLLAFLGDPKNYDEGVKLGLYEPKKQKNEIGEQNQRDPNATKTSPQNKTKNSSDTQTKNNTDTE